MARLSVRRRRARGVMEGPSSFDSLPAEMQVEILRRLPRKEQLALSSVARRARPLLTLPSLPRRQVSLRIHWQEEKKSHRLGVVCREEAIRKYFYYPGACSSSETPEERPIEKTVMFNMQEPQCYSSQPEMPAGLVDRLSLINRHSTIRQCELSEITITPHTIHILQQIVKQTGSKIAILQLVLCDVRVLDMESWEQLLSPSLCEKLTIDGVRATVGHFVSPPPPHAHVFSVHFSVPTPPPCFVFDVIQRLQMHEKDIAIAAHPM